MSPIITIVGRPNVGKSTLFNRLSRSRDALVDDEPGITRDRLYAHIHWNDTPLTIIDTGGFDDSNHEPLLKKVRDQVLKAIEEGDIIIFMVDGRQGIMQGDGDIADLLRRSQKKVLLVVNKIDGPEHDHLVSDFFGLGMEEAYPVSAAHGYGVKALMEHVVSDLPKEAPEMEDNGRVRVAVLGRPNVGKSSLINRILGFERLLVSELPGTTRDSVDTLFSWHGKEYLLIDTAGIRRRGRVKEKIERFSMIKALRSLERCHVAVILLDADAGIAEQDARICGYALERGRALILAVNKWDLVKKDAEKKRLLDGSIERQLQFVSFAPRINLSALTGERVKKLFERIDLLYDQFCKRLSTGVVNKALEELTRKNPPPRIGRGSLKFFYGTQTRIRPPTFVVFANRPDKIHFSYKRYMVNQFRERFNLTHTPIRLIFKKR
jgi:GTP-binding protein